MREVLETSSVLASGFWRSDHKSMHVQFGMNTVYSSQAFVKRQFGIAQQDCASLLDSICVGQNCHFGVKILRFRGGHHINIIWQGKKI